MSGSTPTNNSAVQFEQQQAAQADATEAARQASLAQGMTAINQTFDGTPVMANTTSNYDWSTFDPTKPPAGYTAVRIGGGGSTGSGGSGFGALDPTLGGGASSAGSLASLDPTTAGKSSSGYGDWSLLDPTRGSSAGSGWGLEDASGKIYNPGDPLSITTSTPTGATTGGFDDAFYNNYNQKILNYYQPDEAKQYSEAQRDLTYNLARSGNLQSSVAGDKQGDLAYNDALQKANIVANANAQTGQLKNQIQSNKEDLINQLYATDDPTETANLAESSARASQLQDPTLTPAASLFSPALTAVGSVANYYTNPNQLVQPGAGGPGVTSPTPASSTTSSGKPVNWG